MFKTSPSGQNTLKGLNNDLLFITTSTIPERLKKGQDSHHAIRSHAAKARIQAARAASRPLVSLSTDPEKWTDSRVVRDKYTSKIKLQSWNRKSGRKRKTEPREPKEVEDQGSWYRVRTGSFFLQQLGPLNALPINFFPNTGILLNFYHCLNTNSFGLNPDGDWFDLIRGDAAPLHALLSVSGRIRALQLGVEEHVDVFRHEAEAIKLINERLSDNGEGLSDTLIAAVAVLVNQEAMTRSFKSAQVHMQGLVRMVQLRGGLEKINSKAVLQRVITWSECCYLIVVQADQNTGQTSVGRRRGNSHCFLQNYQHLTKCFREITDCHLLVASKD